MKKLTLLLFSCLFSVALLAQTPVTPQFKESTNHDFLQYGIVGNTPYLDSVARLSYFRNFFLQKSDSIHYQTVLNLFPKADTRYIKKSEFIANVVDYGAVGNGTTDNVLAFRAAKAAVAAHGGGTIWIPAGNFLVSDSVFTQHTNTMWTGDKGAIVHFTNNAHVGFLLYHDSCSVVGLHIVGSGVSSGSNLGGTPIYIQGSNYCRVMNNDISYSGGNAIACFVGQSNNQPTASNTYSYNIISGNNIGKSFGATNTGILLGYSTTTLNNFNKVEFNTIDGSGVLNQGIFFLTNGHGNRINNNIIQNCLQYGAGYYKPASSLDSLLIDNQCSNNYIYNIGVNSGSTGFGSGIYIQGAYRTIVENNQIKKSTKGTTYPGSLPTAAISCNNCGGSLIAENIIDSTFTSPGVNIANSFNGVTVSHNKIYNSFQGVRAVNSNDLFIKDNIALNITDLGVSMTFDTTGVLGARPSQFYHAVTGQNINLIGNTIQSTSAALQVYGVATTDTVSRSSFNANTFKSASISYVVDMVYVKNSSISQNTLIGNNTPVYGLILDQPQSTGDIVDNNKLYTTKTFSTAGIYSYNKEQSIWNNYIQSAGTPIIVNGGYYANNSSFINNVVIDNNGIADNGYITAGLTGQFYVNTIGTIVSAAGITSSGAINFSGLSTNGLVKTTGGTGTLATAVAGTDYQAPISLTTTGTSGAATFSANTLNIPQYTGGATSVSNADGSLTISPTTGAVVASINTAHALNWSGIPTFSNGFLVGAALNLNLNNSNLTNIGQVQANSQIVANYNTSHATGLDEGIFSNSRPTDFVTEYGDVNLPDLLNDGTSYNGIYNYGTATAGYTNLAISGYNDMVFMTGRSLGTSSSTEKLRVKANGQLEGGGNYASLADANSYVQKVYTDAHYIAIDAVNTATDANYTITSSAQFVKLPTITAARTVSIPAAASYTGQQIRILNQNTSGFTWSFTGAVVHDAAGNTLTNLVNTSVYILESDGVNFIKMN